MSTVLTTVEEIVQLHSKDIAYIAEEPPATDLSTFLYQLGAAAGRFDRAGINGYEDVETAGVLLGEAHDADDETRRSAFVKRAATLLRGVDEMTSEYRGMVGDDEN